MAERYKVTERILADHPDGYQVLAAVPGDEIPMERAVELGLVTADGRRRARRRPRRKPGGAEGTVETAEVRRGAADNDSAVGDTDDDADSDAAGGDEG